MGTRGNVILDPILKEAPNVSPSGLLSEVQGHEEAGGCSVHRALGPVLELMPADSLPGVHCNTEGVI